MDFKIILLIILSIGGCNSGVVPQHFISNLTEPVNGKIERIPTDFEKNESNSSLGIKAEISTIAVGNEDLHNSSEVLIVEFHNVSEESHPIVNNNPEETHPIVNNHSEESDHIVNNHSKESDHIVNNHSKDFGHSQKGGTKGSGRPRKKPSKGSNRFKKNISNKTKKFGKVTKAHVTEDSLNESHHLENFTRELSHPEKDFLKKSDHAENLTEDQFKDFSNVSHHAEDFLKESNHFDKDVSKMTNHAENITNITFNHKIINESDQADGIVDHFNHLNNLLNESQHHEDVLNHSNSDVSKGLLENYNLTKPVHQDEHNESSHFENASEIRNETSNDFETIRDFQMHFDNTSGTLDETAESSSNSSKITDDHIAFLNHAENISQDINLRHDPSDLSTFHEDHFQKADVETHSENPASEMNPLIRHESFNSSEITPNDGEILNIGTDVLTASTKENSSDVINQTLLDVLLYKGDNSTLMNPQFNETNDAIMFTVFPNEDHTNASTELSHEFLQDLKVNTNNSKLLTENISSTTIAVEENATQGLFSGISFDFLLNSELAKNAASAMEVFNFTDSALTDHIMDDKNDVHDFLDLIHPSEESDSKEFQGSMEERDNLNETEVDSGLNSSTSEDSVIFKVTTTIPTLLNSTVDFEETTMVSQPMLNSTVDFEETTMVSQPMLNSTLVEVICPPPGFCIFWFLAQDTCAVNSHCLGSRICCRIGCAKTCIEV